MTKRSQLISAVNTYKKLEEQLYYIIIIQKLTQNQMFVGSHIQLVNRHDFTQKNKKQTLPVSYFIL